MLQERSSKLLEKELPSIVEECNKLHQHVYGLEDPFTTIEAGLKDEKNKSPTMT